MIFYDCATAPSPRRARMFIAEKGLTPEIRHINLGKGEHLSDSFRAVNPDATVPVLVTDEGLTLTENNGIVSYLEGRYPSPPLMGETPEQKGLVAQWNALVEQRGGQPIAEALRNGNPAMKGRALAGPVDFEQIPALAERGMQRVGLYFDLLEKRLSETPYLAGENFTWADISAYVFADFARVIRMRIPEENTATRDWFERIAARPSGTA